MGKQQLEAIIFDLDGTLWDSTAAAAKIWKEILKKYKDITDEVTPDKLKTLYGLPLEEIAVRLFTSVSRERAIEVMEACAMEQCPYLAAHGAILLGKIEETLKELVKKYRLFIVSNCKSGYIESFLAGHHLEKYFTDTECPGDSGLLKADNIGLIMKRNNITSAIYAGDTQGDADAAHKAGLDFIFCRYGFGEAKDYEYVIDSFEELPSLLEKISE